LARVFVSLHSRRVGVLACARRELVDDFDWLKAAQSPNWAVLPEAERQPPAWFTKEGEQAEAAGAAMATSTPLEVSLC
jgi:hypothetical protein